MPKQLIKNGERGHSKPLANIHGIYQCCSAALLHGLQSYANVATIEDKDSVLYESRQREILMIPRKRVHSFDEYVKHYSSKNSAFLLPLEYAFCFALEKLYNKASRGVGGENMYASTRYATKTWFIADRRRTEGSYSCLNFMLWLKELGVNTVGRIHISPYRPGAHGGDCKGAVYSPDIPKVRKFLAEKLRDVNSHIEWVYEHYDAVQVPLDQVEPTDEIGALW